MMLVLLLTDTICCEREKGIAEGPAVLALWRSFAWNEAGSPKDGFRLKAELITASEKRLVALLQNANRDSIAQDLAAEPDAP